MHACASLERELESLAATLEDGEPPDLEEMEEMAARWRECKLADAESEACQLETKLEAAFSAHARLDALVEAVAKLTRDCATTLAVVQSLKPAFAALERNARPRRGTTSDPDGASFGLSDSDDEFAADDVSSDPSYRPSVCDGWSSDEEEGDRPKQLWHRPTQLDSSLSDAALRVPPPPANDLPDRLEAFLQLGRELGARALALGMPTSGLGPAPDACKVLRTDNGLNAFKEFPASLCAGAAEVELPPVTTLHDACKRLRANTVGSMSWRAARSVHMGWKRPVLLFPRARPGRPRTALLFLPHDAAQLGSDADYRKSPVVKFVYTDPKDARSVAAGVAATLHRFKIWPDVRVIFQLRDQLDQWTKQTLLAPIYFKPPIAVRSLRAFLELEKAGPDEKLVRTLINQLDADPTSGGVDGALSCLEATQVTAVRELLVGRQMQLSGNRVLWDKTEADHPIGLGYLLTRQWQIVCGGAGSLGACLGMDAADLLEAVLLSVDAANDQERATLTSTVLNQAAAQATKEFVIRERPMGDLGPAVRHTHMQSDGANYDIGPFLRAPNLRNYTLGDMADGYLGYARSLAYASSRPGVSTAVACALLTLAERTLHDGLRLLADADPVGVSKVRLEIGPRAAPGFFCSK